MKASFLLVISFICLLLQSCELNSDHVTDKRSQSSEAAALNTQLGLVYLSQGDYVRAKRKLLTALSQAPDSSAANGAMAYFLEKTDQLLPAKSYYRKAIVLSHRGSAEMNNYGTFLCHQKEYQEAEQYFLEAAENATYTHTAQSYENAGLCALSQEEITKAKAYFKKALSQDPKRKQSLYELVKLEIKYQHATQALSYLRQYSEISMQDKSLLSLAVKAARLAGEKELEGVYKNHLAQFASASFSGKTGENHEYNRDNG